MAELTKHGYDKALKSVMNNKTVFLYKGFDLTHGCGWFCHAYDKRTYRVSFGFSKNRFTAVRKAIL